MQKYLNQNSFLVLKRQSWSYSLSRSWSGPQALLGSRARGSSKILAQLRNQSSLKPYQYPTEKIKFRLLCYKKRGWQSLGVNYAGLRINFCMNRYAIDRGRAQDLGRGEAKNIFRAKREKSILQKT